jgi:hypothetical protein
MTKKEMIKTIIKEEEKAWNLHRKEKPKTNPNGKDSFSYIITRAKAIALWDLARKLELMD